MTYSSFLNRFSAQLVWKHNKRNFQPPANIGSPSYPASSFSLTSSLETATRPISTPVLTPLTAHVSSLKLELKKRSPWRIFRYPCKAPVVATEKILLNVHRFVTWNLHISDSWLNICVDFFTRFSTVGSLRVGRKRTFYVLPKFPSGRKSNASAPPPQMNTLPIDWFWSCLTRARLRVQNFVCPREARKPGGEEGDLCARANRKFLFYYPKFFLPVLLGFTGQGCLPFTKS